MPSTYRIVALGCKVSRADAARIERAFAGGGLERAGGGEPASVCVVCGCAVTAVAEGKSRRAIRRAARENPGAAVVAAGCIAGLDGTARSAGAGLLVPPGRIESFLSGMKASHGAAVFPGRARAFLKVQDGCDGGCSYCIVPLLRGPARSRPAREVMEEARRLVDAGHAEIVLVGVRLGSYVDESDRRRAGLVGLVESILELRARGLERLRLSSIEPFDLTGPNERLAEIAAEGGGLCPHFHLPLQSADDRLLSRMRRPYRLAGYRALLERLRGRIGDVSVTTDVIAGFPGEGEEAHARTVGFIREAGFARVHAFPFSPRPGTPAAEMPHDPPVEVARRRTAELIEAGADSARAYRARFMGREVDVLAEPSSDGTLSGYTERYVRVGFEGPRDLVGKLCRVRVYAETAYGLGGELVT
jgi:threonylcarbamoyladenosine tRNA methylthiotransferase MtaB